MQLFVKLFFNLLFALILNVAVYAEGTSDGGNDFRNTAAEYQEKAKEFGDKGKYDVATLYQRLAEIKLDAANKADQGKWDDIDWSEYEKINEKISTLMHHKK